MAKGETSAVKRAREYLGLYPATPAKTLAMKFDVDTSTIYRAAWWKENKARLEAQQTQR